MRITIIVFVMLGCISLATCEPVILATKFFLKYIAPLIAAKTAGLSGLSGLTGLTGLTGMTGVSGLSGISGVKGGKKKGGIASIVIPSKLYSSIFPRDQLNPPASVVYHSLDESSLNYPPPPPSLPVPIPAPFPGPHDVTVTQGFTQYGPPPPPPGISAFPAGFGPV